MSRHSWMAAGAAMTMVIAAQKEREMDGNRIMVIQQQVVLDNRVDWVSLAAGVRVWVKVEEEDDEGATIGRMGYLGTFAGSCPPAQLHHRIYFGPPSPLLGPCGRKV